MGYSVALEVGSGTFAAGFGATMAVDSYFLKNSLSSINGTSSLLSLGRTGGVITSP